MGDRGEQQQQQASYASGWKDIVAGMAGGAALVATGHPLDTIKVRLQTQPTPLPGQPPKFSGAVDCFVKTARTEGVRGLYKGMSSPLTGVPPIYAVVFGAYGGAKRALQDSPSDPLSITKIFIAGCITGVATTVITVPVELIKARLQIQYARPPGVPATYSGPIDCAVKVLKSEGFAGLYRGSVITLWRDVPGSGAYFAAYEFIKRRFIPEGGTAADVGMAGLLIAGGMGGVANWLAVYPLDIFKSRIQTDTSGKYPPGHTGIMRVASEVWAEGGMRAMFKGLAPCLLRSFPANAACFTVFELTLKMLNSFA